MQVTMGKSENASTFLIICDLKKICLALLNRIAIRRGYAIPNLCVIRLRRCSRRRKLFVQMLSPLKSD